MRIDLDLGKGLEENASVYFEKAKKAKKKLEGAKKTVDTVSQRTKELEAEAGIKLESEKKRKAELQRKKKWYEKYRWFTSSDDYLVIGGRDADTNEEVIKKYADKHDIIFHTEAPGSPFVIIKNPDNRNVPESTRIEAAVFAATFSRAWQNSIRSIEAFEVKPDQVSKEANSGEFIAKGAFMIRGERKIRKVSLSLAVGLNEEGIVMSGPESAVAKHCRKFISLKQGGIKKSDMSNKLMKILGLGSNQEILMSLPSGEFAIVKDKK